MARDLSGLPIQDGFRMRGESVTRLETFVDAAFAFALTMMIISVGQLPQSVADLMQALKRVPTFAVCFAILMIFWIAHNRWSRRFGLENSRTTFLSLLLVFFVLIGIFPLRMVMSGAMYTMSAGHLPPEVDMSSVGDVQDCFLIYGLVFAALSAVMLELNRAALARGDELGLDELERLETRRDSGSHAILLGSALISIALTFLVRGAEGWLTGAPGFVYWLIGPAMFWHHGRFQRLRKALPPRVA